MGNRYLRRALRCLAVLALAAALFDGTPAEGQAVITRTPWQMNRGGGWVYVTPIASHGDISLYNHANVPPAGDTGWGPAPNGDTIGFIEASILPGNCLSSADFTYFQTFVNVPANVTVTQFDIVFTGNIDDGARISIYNSAHPTGLVVDGSYIFLSSSVASTSNLAPYVVPGEVNRVVITQVDDCPVGNNLQSANVVLNGVVPEVCDRSQWKGEGNPNDSVGHNNGVLQGGSYVQGIDGQAFSFNGGSDFVQVPDDNTLDATSEVTFAAWVKPAAGTDELNMLDKSSNADNLPNYRFFLDNTNRQIGYFIGSPFQSFRSNVSVPSGVWSHVAVTVKSGEIRFYLNGQLEPHSLEFGDPTPAVGAPNNHPLRIGSWSFWTSGGTFRGVMDEVVVSTCVLSPSEIADLAAPPNSPPTAVAQNVTVPLDANGQATVSPSQVDGGSSDPDGDALTLSLDVSSFDCSNLGVPNPVTLTATDPSGASASASAFVTVVDNTTPSLTVPGNLVIECGQPVVLGDAIASDNCSVTVTNDAPSEFPLGTTTVTWTATDGSGNSTSGTQDVTIQDTTSPTLTVAYGTVSAECQGPDGTSVDIGTATATDICDPNPSVSNNAPAVFELGETTVTWTAEDASGNKTTIEQLVTIVDTTPPTVSFNPTTTTLWPPNHKMVQVASGISGSDVCDSDPVVAISVTSNEPINGIGDGNTEPDWEVIDGALFLRAERAGGGDGRVYTIVVRVTDGEGNFTEATATVDVPHDQQVAASETSGKGKKSKKPVVVSQVATQGVTVGQAITATGTRTGELVNRGEAVVIDGAILPLELEVEDGIGPAPSFVEQPAQQLAFDLGQNYPNPFNPETVIDYALSEASDVRLVIYNLLGQEVRVLVSGSQAQGQYRVRWDGRDASGYQVTSGIYIYRLVAGSNVATKKMILIK